MAQSNRVLGFYFRDTNASCRSLAMLVQDRGRRRGKLSNRIWSQAEPKEPNRAWFALTACLRFAINNFNSVMVHKISPVLYILLVGGSLIIRQHRIRHFQAGVRGCSSCMLFIRFWSFCLCIFGLLVSSIWLYNIEAINVAFYCFDFNVCR